MYGDIFPAHRNLSSSEIPWAINENSSASLKSLLATNFSVSSANCQSTVGWLLSARRRTSCRNIEAAAPNNLFLSSHCMIVFSCMACRADRGRLIRPPTISANPVRVGAALPLSIRNGTRSSLLTHRGDGKRLVVRADEKLTAVLDLESACARGAWPPRITDHYFF